LTITGADAFALALQRENIFEVFCITGAGNLALVDALMTSDGFKIHYFHNEQAAAMAAIGYFQVSGRTPLVLVTTGGGTSNVATGVLSALMDSIPLLVVTGNESSYHVNSMAKFRAFGVQGFDSVAFLSPITKSSKRCANSSEIQTLIRAAISQATSGRYGPVHIDFPMDLQRASLNEGLIDLETQTIVEEKRNSETTPDFALAERMISDSLRPLILVGAGVRDSITLIKFCENNKIPFSPSWSAFDRYEDSHPLNIGRIGIYGERASNHIVQNADLILCLGTRLAIPQVGYDRNDFGRNAKKIVVEIDELELSKHPDKNYIKLRADANFVLQALMNRDLSPLDETLIFRNSWLEKIQNLRHEFPKFDVERECFSPIDGTVHSVQFIRRLNDLLDEDAIISTDVGAGLLSGHYALQSTGKRRIFTSQGLGEMGFGLPGSIGAGIADSSRQLVCLNTDGGIMFNLQELETVRTKNQSLKLFVFNNDGYAMIKISQGNLFGGRNFGSSVGADLTFPDFSKVAMAFDFEYLEITSSTTDYEIQGLLKKPGAALFDVRMDPNQKYFPRLGTRKQADGTLRSPGIEDLDPQISDEERLRIQEILNG
jgi:acetolactate synthase-1/2/3 large subunit